MAENNQNVNFMPEEVFQAKRKRGRVSAGVKIAVVFLVISVLAWGGLFYNNTLKQREIRRLETEIETQKQFIESQREFGELGHKLGIRLEIAGNLMETRTLYRDVLVDLNDRIPANASITEVTFNTDNSINLKGKAKFNYAPVASFREKILENTDLYKDVFVISGQGEDEQEAVIYELLIYLKPRIPKTIPIPIDGESQSTEPSSVSS